VQHYSKFSLTTLFKQFYTLINPDVASFIGNIENVPIHNLVDLDVLLRVTEAILPSKVSLGSLVFQNKKSLAVIK